jgi:succinate dehydrogenase / fumarate reductase, cytochrome b subunit
MAPTSKIDRPLSPHIGIYRWQITMLLSITHRATGIALTGGALLLVWWLVALAQGGDMWDCATHCMTSLPGQIILLGFCWAVFYHLCAGIRHLAWDMGFGFVPKDARRTSWVVLIASVLFTAVSACVAWG